MSEREPARTDMAALLAAGPLLAARGARSVLSSALGAGAKVAQAGIDSAGALIDGGREIELLARRGALAALDDMFVAAVDLALERLLAEDIVENALTRVERAGVAQLVTERLLDDGIAEQIAQRVLAGPQAERLLAAALDGPLVGEAVAGLLENQAVWVLVDEIARSPSVTEAIAHQGTGFFEQVAEGARERSRKADARVQRIAARIGRRRETAPAPAPPPEPTLPEGPLT